MNFRGPLQLTPFYRDSIENRQFGGQKSKSSPPPPPSSVRYVLTPPIPVSDNSPGVFSCIRAGANTGATCIRPEIISLKNLANMQKMTPQKYFPVFTRVRIQAPHVVAEKLIPQDFFPACIGFVPGGSVEDKKKL